MGKEDRNKTANDVLNKSGDLEHFSLNHQYDDEIFEEYNEMLKLEKWGERLGLAFWIGTYLLVMYFTSLELKYNIMISTGFILWVVISVSTPLIEKKIICDQYVVFKTLRADLIAQNVRFRALFEDIDEIKEKQKVINGKLNRLYKEVSDND